MIVSQIDLKRSRSLLTIACRDVCGGDTQKVLFVSNIEIKLRKMEKISNMKPEFAHCEF